MMTNMEVGKVDPLLELPEVCMRAGKSAKKVKKKTSYKTFTYARGMRIHMSVYLNP